MVAGDTVGPPQILIRTLIWGAVGVWVLVSSFWLADSLRGWIAVARGSRRVSVWRRLERVVIRDVTRRARRDVLLQAEVATWAWWREIAVLRGWQVLMRIQLVWRRERLDECLRCRHVQKSPH